MGKVRVICSRCGKIVERYPSQVSATPFCKVLCQVLHQRSDAQMERNRKPEKYIRWLGHIRKGSSQST